MDELFTIVNDALLPAGEASLLVTDLSIQRGYGIFDFFKTVDGEPVFLEEHFERFFHSAAQMRLDVGQTREKLRNRVEMLLRRNELADSGVRMTLTGGYSPDGYTLARPNLVISQTPLTAPVSRELREPIRLVSYPHRRQLPETKTIDYLMAIWLQPYIRECGADDVLYHSDGIITECPRSNFFLVTAGDRLVTPARGVLHGIIRGKVLELARQQFQVEERDIKLEELRTSKEVFITSTTKHVLPVSQVDGILLEGPRPVSRWLNEELFALMSR